jgi:hypothetical protein
LGHITTIVAHGISIQQAIIAYIILFFFFPFGCEPQLLASICRDVDYVVNLDDPNVWVEACEQHVALFKRTMWWQWKTWPLHNIKILHYDMTPFVDVDINPRFKGLNLGIMFIYNIQHLTHWMWWLGVSFFVWKGFTF